jgi:hypothetical protein
LPPKQLPINEASQVFALTGKNNSTRTIAINPFAVPKWNGRPERAKTDSKCQPNRSRTPLTGRWPDRLYFNRQSIRRASSPQVARQGMKAVGYAFFGVPKSSK